MEKSLILAGQLASRQSPPPPWGIAQLLYNLAHFKNIKVEKELHNSNWIQGVRRISTRKELSQFMDLWSMLKNGEYATASAYKIQFQGSHMPFQIGTLF
jgi:hypothetical protein